MEYHVAKSEARLDIMDKNFQELMAEIKSLRWWVLGVVIGGVITTLGVMICFAQLQASWFQDAINTRKESTDKQIEEMKASWQVINDEMDKRWQAINAEQQKRFEIIMDRMDKRADRLERKLE